MSDATPTMPLDALAIRAILPHRYPFLLIDRVLELKPCEKVHAIKNVSQNEPFFQGHFPQFPVMPGVLLIEALAQAGAIGILSMPENQNKIAMLTGVDNAKFRRPVMPGDQVDLKIEVVRYRRGFGKAKSVATVNGELAVEAEISFAVVDA